MKSPSPTRLPLPLKRRLQRRGRIGATRPRCHRVRPGLRSGASVTLPRPIAARSARRAFPTSASVCAASPLLKPTATPTSRVMRPWVMFALAAGAGLLLAPPMSLSARLVTRGPPTCCFACPERPSALTQLAKPALSTRKTNRLPSFHLHLTLIQPLLYCTRFTPTSFSIPSLV